jgi:hypothetical protein
VNDIRYSGPRGEYTMEFNGSKFVLKRLPSPFDYDNLDELICKVEENV